MQFESKPGSPVSWLQYKPRYRPDIEGLRAIAVLAVVFFHAGFPGFEGGFVGVDVFFVLSGYLITWLLVNEAEQKGSIDLRRFYARRIRRLLPAMAVVLVATLGVTALLYAPHEQRTLARTWVSTVLYVSNIDFAFRTIDYHGASAAINPLLHTWSLSVEEQFYLVWPCLVMLGLGVARWQRTRFAASPRRLLVVLAITTILSFGLSLYLTPREPSWAFYLSPVRAWEFGVGGLAVLLPVGRWPRRVLNPKRSDATMRLLSWIGLVGLGTATVLFDRETSFPGVAALLPVLSTVLLLRAGAPEGQEGTGYVNRFLSLPALQSIGKLSYSWYLWHWPALVFAAALAEPLGFSGRLAAVMGSLVLAYTSYRFVEDPLRHHRMLAGKPARSFAMAVVLSVAGVALTGLWWQTSIVWSSSGAQEELSRVKADMPQIYEDDCDHYGDADLIECVYGDSTAAQTAVLVGDSYAGQWFPALHSAADSAGWRLVVLTLSSCPMVDMPAMHNDRLGRLYTECPEWRQSAIEKIRQLSPTITFVASANGYSVPTQTWEDTTRPVLSAISEHSDRTVLIVATPIPGFDVPVCLARADWRPGTFLDPDCTPRGNAGARDRSMAQVRSAEKMPNVEVLNLRDEVCEIGACEATTEGLARFRDDGHLSREFALTFEGVFRAYLTESMDLAVVQPQANRPGAPTSPQSVGGSQGGNLDLNR